MRVVAGQQAEVGVDARRAGVVVAGADVRVAAQAVVVLAHHQDHLAVRLQPDHAVGDVDAVLLQLGRRSWMLAASSKRAFSSTTTATCLPLRAASRR